MIRRHGRFDSNSEQFEVYFNERACSGKIVATFDDPSDEHSEILFSTRFTGYCRADLFVCLKQRRTEIPSAASCIGPVGSCSERKSKQRRITTPVTGRI